MLALQGGSRAVVLASSSPRRRELLALAGVQFQVRPTAADETVAPGEAPGDYVQRLSRAKARLAAQHAAHEPGAVIVAADTTVVLDEADGPHILGKPADAGEATGMLRRLRGRTHRVLTAITVLETAGAAAPGAAIQPVTAHGVAGHGPPAYGAVEQAAATHGTATHGTAGQRPVAHAAERSEVVTARVPMRDYGDDEIAAYVATGNPLDKAGAYAIQFSRFKPVDAEAFGDCFATVMGLPACRVLALLARAGVPNTLSRPPADCHHFDPSVCPMYPLINQDGER